MMLFQGAARRAGGLAGGGLSPRGVRVPRRAPALMVNISSTITVNLSHANTYNNATN